MFDVTPDGADGEAGAGAEHVAAHEHHRRRRLDVGNAAKASRPRPSERPSWPRRPPPSRTAASARTSHAGASATSTSANEASCQLMTRPPGAPPAPRDLGASRAQQRGALLGQQRAAGAAQDARGLGGEVPAAGEHVGGGPSAITRPSAISTTRSAKRRRTRRRGWRPSPPARLGAFTQPRRERDPWRRDPCRAWARRARAPPAAAPPPMTIASARRWRSPPERSRGWRSAAPASPAAASAARGRLVARRARAGSSRRGSAAAAPRGRRAAAPRVGSSRPGGVA